jgi:exocyst complex component 7
MTSTPHNLRDLETARGAALGNALAEDQVFNPVHPEAIDDLRVIADQLVHVSLSTPTAPSAVACSMSTSSCSAWSASASTRCSTSSGSCSTMHGVKTVVCVLLAGERRLYDQVLSASEQLREECFIESTKGCIMHILNFGDAVALCPHSPERVPQLLEMYEALAEVIPEMKDLCLGSSGESIISDVQ